MFFFSHARGLVRALMMFVVMALVAVVASVNMSTASAATALELVNEPGFEGGTIGSTTPPGAWQFSTWSGTGKVVGTAHTGTKAFKTSLATATTGSANVYQKVNVTPGTTVSVSAWVSSSTATELGVQALDANGSEGAYTTIASIAKGNTTGNGDANLSWTKLSGVFSVPTGVNNMLILVPVPGKGWNVVDDFSVISAGSSTFSQGIVSCAMDDGWASQQLMVAIRKQLGINCTDYVIGNTLHAKTTTGQDNLSDVQLKAMLANGDEIGNHTWSHPDGGLKGMTPTQIASQMDKTQTGIKTHLGVTPTSFAMPQGTYDGNVQQACSTRFSTCRSVDSVQPTYSAMTPAFFKADGQAKYRLMSYNVSSSTTPADISALAAYAKANKVWIIVTFHEFVETGSSSVGGDIWYTPVPDGKQMFTNLKNSGVTTMTVAAAWSTINGQLAAA